MIDVPHDDLDQGSPLRGRTRVLRAGVLGGSSLALAVLAHLVGGGRVPGAGVLVVSGLLLAVSAATLTARRCRFAVLLPVLLVQQVLLHLVFDVAAGAGACVPAGTGMTHGVPVTACVPDAAMSGMSAPGWSMWLAHLAATALTCGLLARGEAWLWRMTERIVTAATAAPSPATRGARPRPPAPARVLGVRTPIRSAAAPRAPPVTLAVS